MTTNELLEPIQYGSSAPPHFNMAQRSAYSLLYPETCSQVETTVHHHAGLVVICIQDRYSGENKGRYSCTLKEFREAITYWSTHP